MLPFSFVSCQLSKTDEIPTTQAEVKKQPKRSIKGIGEIISINSDEQFVIIDVIQPDSASGQDLFYVEKGSRSAVLKPTGERLGKYYVADIVNGNVSLKDPVIVKVETVEPVEPEPVVAETPVPTPEPAVIPAATSSLIAPPTDSPVDPPVGSSSVTESPNLPPKRESRTPPAPSVVENKPVPPPSQAPKKSLKPNQIPIDLPPGYTPAP